MEETNRNVSQGNGCLSWFLGIVLSLTLSVTLLSFTAYLGSQEKFLTKITQSALISIMRTIRSSGEVEANTASSLFSSMGIPLNDLREMFAEQRGEVLDEFVKTYITNVDLDEVDDAEVAEISGKLAETFIGNYYSMPIKAILAELGMEQDDGIPAELLESEASFESINLKIRNFTLIFAGISVLMLALLVASTRGFGRLSGPGGAILVATIPGIYLFISYYRKYIIETKIYGKEMAATNPFIQLIQSAYLAPFLIGLILLVAGLIGSSVAKKNATGV